MSLEEKDRLYEILFYLYFNNKDGKILSSNQFWQVITSICVLYNINERAVIQAVRILMPEENRPKDDETVYLLGKLGLTVRPIRKISGIYWQKQKAFNEQFEYSTPVIKRRLTDIVHKQSVREFIDAVYDLTGTFAYVDKSLLERI